MPRKSNDIQFRIIVYLPKESVIAFSEFRDRWQHALALYQKNIDEDMYWYYMKKSGKITDDDIVYFADNFTEHGIKKLTFAHRRIEKGDDPMISLADRKGVHGVGQVSIYDVTKHYYVNPQAQSDFSSSIEFFFTKSDDQDTLKKVINLVTDLAKVFTDSYITIQLETRFTGLDQLFPQRLTSSILCYIPSPLQAEDYPEAHQLISIYKDDQQVGAVIVVLDHFIKNKDPRDIKTIHRIDLRLREADLLPKHIDL